ncbi:MAG: MGMT family protein [bacterium]
MGDTFLRIRKIVSQIPKKKVATYGEIAAMAGVSNPRVVGWAMRGNQEINIPCHRVVMAKGFLAERYSLGGWLEQRRRLEKDGIVFTKERQVDMEKYSWKRALAKIKNEIS